jgi:excisionase family DNA binding protein
MKQDSGTRFITPREFIERTDLPRNTVYTGLADGSIPSIRISKRKILIPEDALERMLAGKANAYERPDWMGGHKKAALEVSSDA